MLFSLNFGILMLIPKLSEAIKIEQYHPICMLNLSFKFFTKVTDNRLTLVASKVIGPSPIGFPSGTIYS
jgi:hypothetical protein